MNSNDDASDAKSNRAPTNISYCIDINRQDVYNALTNRGTLDAVLQQGLDKEYQKYKHKIVELFMSIKDKVRIEDLTFYG